MLKINRALISVFDKTGVVKLAKALREFDVEILSTGGTARTLRDNGIPVREVSDVTGFPPLFGGRVKTLHPKILGGLLALRDEAQVREAQAHDVPLIDLVVVNLYPFEQVTRQGTPTLEEALEHIDIGGVTLLRAAAKNFPSVAVVSRPSRYEEIIAELQSNRGHLSLETRRHGAIEAFGVTSQYDSLIGDFLCTHAGGAGGLPRSLHFDLEKVQDLRYGENPHQRGAFYRRAGAPWGVAAMEQLQGKALSFNNLLDIDAAARLAQQFDRPCAAILKHTNPCGVGVGETLLDAFRKAWATDPISAFGGIVGLNRAVDNALAEELAKIFLEVIVALDFSEKALDTLRAKKHLRLLKYDPERLIASEEFDVRSVAGAVLVQDQNLKTFDEGQFRVVSQRPPTAEEWDALRFAWKVVKWVKSNAIVFAHRDRTLGIGAGQMSRVDSVHLAALKAKKAGLSLQGTGVASDGFFPFRDGVDTAAEAGATAIIQPGGSLRDEEVISAANQHGVAMVFTGIRHFRH